MRSSQSVCEDQCPRPTAAPLGTGHQMSRPRTWSSLQNGSGAHRRTLERPPDPAPHDRVAQARAGSLLEAPEAVAQRAGRHEQLPRHPLDTRPLSKRSNPDSWGPPGADPGAR